MATIPYIGSRISLISNSEIRYEGVLYTINTNESTIALQSVKSFGTEGRKHPEVQATNEVYDFIIFRGKDIKDLTVLEGGNKSSPALQDPAIVQVKNAKSPSTFPVGKGSGKGAAPGAANGKGWNSNNWQQPQQWEQGQRNWQQNQSNSYNGPQQNWGQPYNGSGQWDGWTQGQDYTQNWNQGYGKGKGKGARNSYTANWEQGAEWKGRGDQSGRLYNRGRNNPVGELVPNENKVAKAAVEKDFDLTEANAKFEKVSADSKEETQLGSYDKTKSFFDSISCEAIERAKGPTDRPDAKKIRETDRSTFGDATVNSHRFGGRGRGKGYKGAGRGKGVKGGKGYGGKGRAF